MNREKEILLQLLLEKYATTTTEIKVNPITQIKTNSKRRREPAIYANVHWTVADVAAVDQGKKQGMSVETIAKNIGRSKKSVLAIVKMLDGRYAYTRPIVLQYLALKKGK